MKNDRLDQIMADAMQNITYVIEEVSKRGYEDTEQEVDNYQVLVQRREFKDLITAELYEAFFLPQRHEFDWQIIHQIVDFLTSTSAVEFTSLSVASGLVGGIAYDILKTTLKSTVEAMKNTALPSTRYEPYAEMLTTAEKIQQFFHQEKAARIAEIEDATQLPRERIYPFLKLLGFSHHRRKHNCIWSGPNFELE